MKALLYMVRHGESLGNQTHSFLGHTDLALTDKGRLQATLAGKYLRGKGIVPDAVWASPLVRAYETARLVSGVDAPIPNDGLREIFAGEWEGLAFSEIAERYPAECERWNCDIGASRPVGGESVAALFSRVLSTVWDICAKNEGKTVLIGSHATPIRMVETYARGFSVAEASHVPFPSNASLSAYLVEGKNILPIFYSYDAYLGEISTTLPQSMNKHAKKD